MNSRFKKNKQNIENKGFTIIEMVVYIALFGLILTVLFNMITMAFQTNNRIIASAKVNSDTHGALERMTYEIINSHHIYLPTSNFDTSPDGQLSIVSQIELVDNEQETFLDFYLENDTLFLKKEGHVPVALTSADVLVSNLKFSYHQNGNRESVSIEITINSAKNGMSDVKIHTISTSTLRSI